MSRRHRPVVAASANCPRPVSAASTCVAASTTSSSPRNDGIVHSWRHPRKHALPRHVAAAPPCRGGFTDFPSPCRGGINKIIDLPHL
jgi:hypothetical protein